jgi:hypothetical protein
MTEVFYGFISGLILGLIASVVIAAITLPPNISYQHFTVDGKAYDCVSWESELMCRTAQQPVSMGGGDAQPARR